MPCLSFCSLLILVGNMSSFCCRANDQNTCMYDSFDKFLRHSIEVFKLIKQWDNKFRRNGNFTIEQDMDE
jgi:hypothetical protein